MSGSATPTSDTVSPRSQRFRDSVHNIPTPGTEVHRPKRYVSTTLLCYKMLFDRHEWKLGAYCFEHLHRWEHWSTHDLFGYCA